MQRSRKRAINPEVAAWLDQVYRRYHHRDYIGSDPLQFLYRYHTDGDREVVGLIAASLAYGNVTTINNSVSKVLAVLGPSPRDTLVGMTVQRMREQLGLFRHRWTGAAAMADFLGGISSVINEYGSLGEAFRFFDRPGQPIAITLANWVYRLQSGRPLRSKELLADPGKKSACKRLHLYLRWMIRNDEIDPGCWTGIDPSRLMMPLDTHVFKFARAAAFTRRHTADFRTVEDITNSFRLLCPHDPVRYDFALTRPGIIEGWRPDKSSF